MLVNEHINSKEDLPKSLAFFSNLESEVEYTLGFTVSTSFVSDFQTTTDKVNPSVCIAIGKKNSQVTETTNRKPSVASLFSLFQYLKKNKGPENHDSVSLKTRLVTFLEYWYRKLQIDQPLEFPELCRNLRNVPDPMKITGKRARSQISTTTTTTTTIPNTEMEPSPSKKTTMNHHLLAL